MLQTFLETFDLEDKWVKLINADGLLTSVGYDDHHVTLELVINTNVDDLSVSDMCVAIEQILRTSVVEVLSNAQVKVNEHIDLVVATVLLESMMSFLDGLTPEDVDNLEYDTFLDDVIDKYGLSPTLLDEVEYIGDIGALLPSRDEMVTEEEPEPLREFKHMDKIKQLNPPAMVHFLSNGGKPLFDYGVYKVVVDNYYLDNPDELTMDALARDFAAIRKLSCNGFDVNVEQVENTLGVDYDLSLDQLMECIGKYNTYVGELNAQV